MGEDRDSRGSEPHSRRGSEHAGGGTLVTSDDVTFVGDTITFKGRNLPDAGPLELLWHSVQGQWGVLEANEIVGPQYRPRTETIETIEPETAGRFDCEWTVPPEYGGTHSVELLDQDGATVAETTVTIAPWFDLKNDTAQLGDSFAIRGYGLGPDVMVSNYQLAWDNGTVGIVTGVMNRGTATAEIRAAGPPGEHLLQVWRNYRGVPYLLNNTQSPYGRVAGDRQSAWTVTVTDPESEPPTAWVDERLDEQPIETHYPALDTDTDATLEITPSSGQAGTTAELRGRDFPPNREIALRWYSHRGHEPRGTDAPPDPTVTPVPKPGVLPTVSADAEGRFAIEVTIPRDIGATRPITAAVDGREVAVAGFVLQPSIERFEPTSGPVGTEIEIDLSGIGWTAYGNAPFFVYDNHPLGYVCGTGGDEETGLVSMVLQAAGDPGYHFIDAYPSLFHVEQEDPDFECRPHLSYLDNHPGRPLPALHFTFEVTD